MSVCPRCHQILQIIECESCDKVVYEFCPRCVIEYDVTWLWADKCDCCQPIRPEWSAELRAIVPTTSVHYPPEKRITHDGPIGGDAHKSGVWTQASVFTPGTNRGVNYEALKGILWFENEEDVPK